MQESGPAIPDIALSVSSDGRLRVEADLLHRQVTAMAEGQSICGRSPGLPGRWPGRPALRWPAPRPPRRNLQELAASAG